MECIEFVVKLSFKTAMLRSSLCDYSDMYLLAKGTITVPNTGTVEATSNRNKKSNT